MKLPDTIRSQLATRWQNGHRQWIAGKERDAWPLAVSLCPPTEPQALAQKEGFAMWVRAWRSWSGPGEVRWSQRRWRILGEQRLPEKLVLEGPEEVAELIGQATAWKMASERIQGLLIQWPSLDGVLHRSFDYLSTEPEGDFRRLCALLAWLVDNPGSGLYPRQVPVTGVHSKWLERRRGLLTTWINHLRGMPEAKDSADPLGLREPPHLIQILALDPEIRRGLGGLRYLAASAEELAGLALHPCRILVVENKQSALALPDLPGTVAFVALGKGVSVLADLPWVSNARIDYWGDIDTHGFHALDLARRRLPDVRSVLMDRSTLLAHRELWGEEDSQHSAADLLHLDDAERALYDELKRQCWGQNVRLEQERIAWDWALDRVVEAD